MVIKLDEGTNHVVDFGVGHKYGPNLFFVSIAHQTGTNSCGELTCEHHIDSSVEMDFVEEIEQIFHDTEIGFGELCHDLAQLILHLICVLTQSSSDKIVEQIECGDWFWEHSEVFFEDGGIIVFGIGWRIDVQFTQIDASFQLGNNFKIAWCAKYADRTLRSTSTQKDDQLNDDIGDLEDVDISSDGHPIELDMLMLLVPLDEFGEVFSEHC